MTDLPKLSPEVKAVIKDWVARQRKKYGDDWKAKKAAEMTAQTMPAINRLLDVLQKVKR